MSIIIVFFDNLDDENDEEEELQGEEWMYDDDINSGIY